MTPLTDPKKIISETSGFSRPSWRVGLIQLERFRIFPFVIPFLSVLLK